MVVPELEAPVLVPVLDPALLVPVDVPVPLPEVAPPVDPSLAPPEAPPETWPEVPDVPLLSGPVEDPVEDPADDAPLVRPALVPDAPATLPVESFPVLLLGPLVAPAAVELLSAGTVPLHPTAITSETNIGAKRRIGRASAS